MQLGILVLALLQLLLMWTPMNKEAPQYWAFWNSKEANPLLSLGMWLALAQAFEIERSALELFPGLSAVILGGGEQHPQTTGS